MDTFTPGSALIGGGLIGVSATLLLGLCGRIVGISGIAGGLLSGPPSDRPWRGAFVAGLIAGGVVLRWLQPDLLGADVTNSRGLLLGAGLLVGFGTRLGGGCTSGHGVCGLSRLSPRSIVATITFMAGGAVTVLVVRHLVGGGP